MTIKEPLDIAILRYLKPHVGRSFSSAKLPEIHDEIDTVSPCSFEQFERTLKALGKEELIEITIFSGGGNDWKVSLKGIAKDGLVLLRRIDGPEQLELTILEYLKPKVEERIGVDELYDAIRRLFPCSKQEFQQTLAALEKEGLIEATPNMSGHVIGIQGIAKDGLTLLRSIGS